MTVSNGTAITIITMSEKNPMLMRNSKIDSYILKNTYPVRSLMSFRRRDIKLKMSMIYSLSYNAFNTWIMREIMTRMTWYMEHFMIWWLISPIIDNMTMSVMNLVMSIPNERIMTLLTHTLKMQARTMLIMTMMLMQTVKIIC